MRSREGEHGSRHRKVQREKRERYAIIFYLKINDNTFYIFIEKTFSYNTFW